MRHRTEIAEPKYVVRFEVYLAGNLLILRNEFDTLALAQDHAILLLQEGVAKNISLHEE